MREWQILVTLALLMSGQVWFIFVSLATYTFEHFDVITSCVHVRHVVLQVEAVLERLDTNRTEVALLSSNPNRRYFRPINGLAKLVRSDGSNWRS